MGNEKTDGERLAALEAQMAIVAETVTQLDKKFDEMRDEQIRELRESQRTSRQSFPVWVSAGAAIMSLVALFWPHGK